MTIPESVSGPHHGRFSFIPIGLAFLAFLLASTVTQSADVWWYLAEGRRLLASADFWHPLPGGPPRSGAFYSLWVYAVWGASAAYGVVAAHAILAAATTLVAFGGPRSSHNFVSAAVATVAILATGLHPSTTPAAASLFLLAVALRLARVGQIAGRRDTAFLVLLFVIWANTDAWFVPGIIVVTATLVGRACDAVPGSRSRLVTIALGTSALIIASCLLNPFVFKAFQFPAEFGAGRLGSPFAAVFRAGPGRCPAGVAFYALLGLGLLSVVVSGIRRRRESFFPLVLVSAAACWDAVAIPVFAIVGGPIIAQSLSDVLGRHATATSTRGRARAGVAAALMLGAAFLVAAWPGWLQAPPYAPRGWVVDPPEALALAAETTAQWYADGSLPQEARVLHLGTESAKAFAWHARTVPSVVDERVSGELKSGSLATARLDDAGIRVVVASNAPGEVGIEPFVMRCLNDPRWQLLAIRGRVWILGWRGSSPVTDPFQRILSARTMTGVGADAVETLADPEERPTRHWTDPFLRRAPRQTTDRDRGANFIVLAEAFRAGAGRRHAEAWNATHFAGLVGSAAGFGTPAAPAEMYALLTIARWQTPPPTDPSHALVRALAPARGRFAGGRDDAPLPMLYAAIRACRKAVDASPTDALAHAVLGECYLRLLQNSREREWAARFPEFGRLRSVQAVTALHRAVTLDPSLASAHLNLWAAYRSDGALDLALVHLTRYVELTAAGPETPVARGLAELREVVAAREKEYAINANKLRVSDRAESAVQLGLIGRGRDVLRESDVAAFGAAGAELELNLLLRSGHADEVRDMELGDTVKLFDPVAYRWIRVQALAGTGYYAAAARETGGISTSRGLMSRSTQRQIATYAGRFVLDQGRTRDAMPLLFQEAFTASEGSAAFTVAVADHRTALSRDVILGILAFEAGDLGNAKAAFQSVLGLSPDSGVIPPSPHKEIARQMLQFIP